MSKNDSSLSIKQMIYFFALIAFTTIPFWLLLNIGELPISENLRKSFVLVHTVLSGVIIALFFLKIQKTSKKFVNLQKQKEGKEFYIKNVEEFISRLYQDDLETSFESNIPETNLEKLLFKFQEKLKDFKKNEVNRVDKEQKERWLSEGIAKFETLIRENADNQDNLAYIFISNLVKYVEANQAGFFVKDDNETDNDKVYKLSACFAWGRKKFTNKEIMEGEGLIGACIFEKEPIYMIDIPDGYIEITSGLGYTNPRSLFIVPLIHNESVIAALEIASLKEIPSYKREFIEKITISMASALTNLKITKNTSKLLEQSKIQAEQLQSQEEELKQNLEEMQSTQEELERKQHRISEIATEVMVEEKKLRLFIEELKGTDN